MKKIILNKDSRLPEGYDSWTQIAKDLPNQDRLIRVTEKRISFTPDVFCEEIFEADRDTLKIRAFDEIREVIPSIEDMEQMYHHAHYQDSYDWVSGSGTSPLSDFVTKIAILFYPERFR